MGKQIRFFMSRKDETDFLKIVVQFNHYILDNKLLVLTVEEAAVSTTLSFFLTTQEFNVSKDKNGFIDPIVAEAIQLSRCMQLEYNYLRSGRLWAELKYYDNNREWRAKSEKFSNMYNVYEKWIKKNFRQSKCRGYYIGEDAYRAYKEDGIILLDGPKQKVEFD